MYTQAVQEIQMPVTQDKPGPYAPATAILDIVGRYRSRGLPFPVNSDVLARAGISDSLIPRTLQTLQTLDLIKDTGNPTETLEGIRLAPNAEYKLRLADWLKSAYAEVFAFVDPTTDDDNSIRDAFRSYQPIAQQARMVTLFKGLCAAAGLMPEKSSSPRTSPQPVRSPRVVSTATRAAPARRVVSSITPKASGAALPPALAGLMESLPSDGWTAAQRTKFLATFQAVLDFVVPVVTKAQKDKGDDED
jgi:hypothetical protein